MNCPLRAQQDVCDKTSREGTQLVLAGVQDQPRRVLERGGLVERIGRDNVFAGVDEALARARALAV